MLNRSGEKGYAKVVLILGKKAVNVSQLNMMFTLCFTDVLYQVEKVL